MSESVIRNLEIRTNQNRRLARAMTGGVSGTDARKDSHKYKLYDGEKRRCDPTGTVRKQTIRLVPGLSSPRRAQPSKICLFFSATGQQAGMSTQEVFFADIFCFSSDHRFENPLSTKVIFLPRVVFIRILNNPHRES
jgi:hypothetical protein